MKAIGIIFILTGLLWVGQGMGFVHWPPGSFMINDHSWTLRGALFAIVGVVIVISAARASR